MPPDHAVFELAETASETSVELVGDGIAEAAPFGPLVPPEGANVSVDRDGLATGPMEKVAILVRLKPTFPIGAGLWCGEGVADVRFLRDARAGEIEARDE